MSNRITGLLGQRKFPVGARPCQAYCVASLNIKELTSPTPLNCVRKALILALKDSADAFVQINLALFHTMTEVLSSQYIKFFLLVQQDSFQVLLYPLLPFFCYKGSK